MDDLIQIQCTVRHLDEARDILEVLLEKDLISCGSIVPSIESWYVWENEIVSSEEVKIFMKTVDAHYDTIEKIIKKYHSYDIPEILVFSIEDGNKEYLQWVTKQVVK
jgi:periplasmic divalent cation tolerance protein